VISSSAPTPKNGPRPPDGPLQLPARKARLRPQFSASTGAERTGVREHRSAAKTQAPAGICGRANKRVFASAKAGMSTTAASVTTGLDMTRRRLAAYATVTLVGIALSVLSDETLGAVVTVGSLVMLIWTLHRFGRAGPD
jgi:hypothetical protein